MLEKLSLFLLSLFLGLGSFFSFYIAPTLFRVLERNQAGAVVEKIFPVYFGLGLILVTLALFLGRDSGKVFIFLGVINLALLGVEFFYVVPTMHKLKQVNYQLFMRYHGVSMGINLLILLFTFIKAILIILKR